jgi:hypothetical protein
MVWTSIKLSFAGSYAVPRISVPLACMHPLVYPPLINHVEYLRYHVSLCDDNEFISFEKDIPIFKIVN